MFAIASGDHGKCSIGCKWEQGFLNGWSEADTRGFFGWCNPNVLVLQWAPSMKKLLQSGVLQPSLLLLSQSNVGAHLLHNLPGKRIIGSIIFPDISMVSSCLHLLNYLTGKGQVFSMRCSISLVDVVRSALW